jgi:PadR family transcriptional regulator PadR
MRKTEALSQVAIEIMRTPSERFWGYPLGVASGLRSGILYPILQRMLDQEWLTDGWEQIDPSIERRPARRYYTLTDLGARELGAIAAAAAQPRLAQTRGLGVA